VEIHGALLTSLSDWLHGLSSRVSSRDLWLSCRGFRLNGGGLSLRLNSRSFRLSGSGFRLSSGLRLNGGLRLRSGLRGLNRACSGRWSSTLRLHISRLGSI
jgi:hypothetical protein